MRRQDLNIASILQNFLKESNKADYAIKDKRAILDKYFNLVGNEDNTTLITIKTSGEAPHHLCTSDIVVGDIDNLFSRIRLYSKQVLYHQYNIIDA